MYKIDFSRKSSRDSTGVYIYTTSDIKVNSAATTFFLHFLITHLKKIIGLY